MEKEKYKLLPSKQNTRFYFLSQGQKGAVVKVIVFQYSGNKKWNLAFGDLKPDNDFDDNVLTNNNDVAKVMATVAEAGFRFFEKRPDCIIFIQPVDEKRKRLYNLVFQRNFEYFSQRFEIWGKSRGRWKVYDPFSTFNAFKVMLKPF